MKRAISITLDIFIIFMFVAAILIFIGGIIGGIVVSFVYDPYWYGIEIVTLAIIGPFILMIGVYGFKLIKISIIGTVESVEKITDGIKEARINSTQTNDVDFKFEEENKFKSKENKGA